MVNYKFIPRTATANPVSLKVSIPVYDNESNEQIRTGITEKLVLTCDIKVGIEKNSNPDPKPTPVDPEPITPGDESEVAIRLINGYTIDSRGNVKIDYSNAKMPILHSGIYNDVFFALELKNGNYFNSPSLELTERGNVTEWFSDIPTVKYDYSAYISACPGTRRDKDSKVLILCLHILPKELAKDGEMLTPSITVKPKDTKNSNPYVKQFYTILKGEDDYVKDPIVVQDKLHMQVKRDNYAGVYFENNHNWSTSCGNNPGAWRLKLVNLKLKDPKMDISKFATIKGFAPNGRNSQADEKLEQMYKKYLKFTYTYLERENIIEVRRKPVQATDPSYKDWTYADGLIVEFDKSIFEQTPYTEFIKSSDAFYYCADMLRLLDSVQGRVY